jgi:hypothetical protein
MVDWRSMSENIIFFVLELDIDLDIDFKWDRKVSCGGVWHIIMVFGFELELVGSFSNI